MKVFESFVDLIGFLIIKIKDLIHFFFDLIFDLLRRIYQTFQEINFSEKIVFLNIIPAFFAVIVPVARFYIFESYFYINNPLAVYLIGIIFVMFASIYFTGLIKLIARLLINGYYLFWIIYLPVAGELTKADPYEIYFGYYMNIAVPVIFIIFSFLSYFMFNDQR
jgi:hypothetical protein